MATYTQWNNAPSSFTPPILPIAWQILMLSNNGHANYLSVAELQFRSTEGGGNVPGTYASNSNFSAAYNAAKAFDGSGTTYWCSVSGVTSNAYLRSTYSSGRTIRQVALTCYAELNEGPVRMPKDFKIQYSINGTTWVDALSVTNATGWTTGETRVFNVPALYSN